MDPEQEQVAKKAAKALKARIDLIQKHLDPILAGPLSETYGKLPTNEKAQFEVLLSFALNTLYYIYLKTYGVNPLDHEVTNELQRVKQYIEKIKIAEGRGPKRSMELDKDAADRFIKSALAGDEQEQSSEEKEGDSSRKRRLGKEKSRDEEEEPEVVSSSSSAPAQARNNNNNGTRKRPRMDPFVAPRNGSY